MKTEPKIGDYVEFKKPYVGEFPVGIIIAIERWNWNNKPVYKISIPEPGNSFIWRVAPRLIKSSEKKYNYKNMIKKLEKN